MSLALCGLISASLLSLGLLAASSRRFPHRRPIGLGLMLQAGLLLLVAAARQLGQLDGHVVALLGAGLLPLTCLPGCFGAPLKDRVGAEPSTEREEP